MRRRYLTLLLVIPVILYLAYFTYALYSTESLATGRWAFMYPFSKPYVEPVPLQGMEAEYHGQKYAANYFASSDVHRPSLGITGSMKEVKDIKLFVNDQAILRMERLGTTSAKRSILINPDGSEFEFPKGPGLIWMGRTIDGRWEDVSKQHSLNDTPKSYSLTIITGHAVNTGSQTDEWGFGIDLDGPRIEKKKPRFSPFPIMRTFVPWEVYAEFDGERVDFVKWVSVKY